MKYFLFIFTLFSSVLFSQEVEFSIQQNRENAAIELHFKMREGWHLYWKNPGEAGAAPSIEAELPEGFAFSELQFPPPKRFEVDGVVGFGYEDELVLTTFLLSPPGHPLKEPSISGTVHWFACKESCIPGQQEFSLKLQATESLPDEKARKELSGQLEEGKLSFSWESEEDLKKVEFFPLDNLTVDIQEKAILEKLSPNRYQIQLTLLQEPSTPVEGLLVINKEGVKEALKVSINPFPLINLDKLLFASLFAFIGGLILNLMPCVLPVISLKILSLIKLAGSEKKEIFRHSLLFSFGILSCFWAVASLLLFLQWSGAQIGWGFHLQSALFVAFLNFLLFALALNLFGLFEWGTSIAAKAGSLKAQKGYLGAFLNGVLATLVATPCTGPFLGATLGYAVTLPPLASLLIFTMMAIGMSLPYLLLALFPSLIRWIPKPGGWMVRMKEFMGFLLIASLLWLLWVFEGLTSSSATFQLMLALLLAGFALWLYRFFLQKKRRAPLMLLFLLLLGFSFQQAFQAANHSSEQKEEEALLPKGWERFDPERVEELVASKKPLFIDFTARWCLICKVNEAALFSQPVSERFEQLNVTRMVADWTKLDPMITRELKKHGRNGVPLYVFYPPGKEPILLPQTLTPQILLEVLNLSH